MSRAAFLYPLDEDHRRRLTNAWPWSLEFVTAETQEAVDEIADEELEVIIGDFVPRDLGRVPGLRWLQYTGAGVDALVERAPWREGITVTTASGVNALAIGEYVHGAMALAAGRWRARLSASSQRAWDPADASLESTSLRGRTLGIVGYGSIGRETARLAVASGMTVMACKRDPSMRIDTGYVVVGAGDPQGSLPTAWFGIEGVGEMAASSDFLLLAAPLTEATRGLIDESILSRLPSGAWLINVSRGELVDDGALIDRLERGHLAGAVLDVAPEEPLPPGHRLWSAPNTIITPHIAAWSPYLWDGLIDLFAQNLARYAAGSDLLNVVDPTHGY